MRNQMFQPITAVVSGAVVASALICTSAFGQDSDPIYYGSRAGMHVTTVSSSGLGTANATIFIKHTPKDAKAACVEYDQDYSMACVKRTMAEVKVRDRVMGNCQKGTFADVYGEAYIFLGRPKTKPSDGEISMADYVIKRVSSGETLDGSSASGYGVVLTVFQHLCPGIAK